MPNVLVLNQYAKPAVMGGGTRHVELFKSLGNWKAKIVASSRTHPSQDELPRVEPFILVDLPRYSTNGARRVLGFVVYAVKAARIAISAPDLSLIYASSPHLLTPVAGLIAARIRRVPIVLEVRDLWPESIRAAGYISRNSISFRMLALLERALSRAVDAIVVVTPGWENHYETMGIKPDKVHVIPNGAQKRNVHPSSETAEARPFRAVFAGSHGPKDGIHYVLDAAMKLPDVDFLLIGDGPEKQNAIARTVAERIHNVEFRDRVSKDQLYQTLADADVGIHAVTPLDVFELGMSPNKLFDYLSAGIPIVSNARTPLRHVIQNDECGIIGGPQDLAEAIKSVREAEPATRRRWIEAGSRLIDERFSREKSRILLHSVLEKTLRAASKAGEPTSSLGRRWTRCLG